MNDVETAREQTAPNPLMPERIEIIVEENQQEKERSVADEQEKDIGEPEQAITIEEESSEKEKQKVDDQITQPRMTTDSQALQNILGKGEDSNYTYRVSRRRGA